MRILVISGSRNRQGKTARTIDAIARGVAKAGGNSESIFLTEHTLERCRQCNDDGWGDCRSKGQCIIEDDFASIVNKIEAADVMVFANPVYFGDLSESMMGFLDRLRRIKFSMLIAAGRGPGSFPSGGGTPAIGPGAAVTGRYPAALTWKESCRHVALTSWIWFRPAARTSRPSCRRWNSLVNGW